MSDQTGQPRDLRLDWADEEIVDGLADALAYELREAADVDKSPEERQVIEKAFREIGDDDPSTAAWLSEADNRQRVEAAARQKLRAEDES